VAGLAAQIKTLEPQIAGQLAAHPDSHIFTSLPRAGTLRAARLLAEIGDCRSRFPDPWALAALAGTAPVTRRSGTHISHTFRWAVNRQLNRPGFGRGSIGRTIGSWQEGLRTRRR
jgi:transposase